MKNKIKNLYGLRWNPFLPDVPVDSVYCSAATTNFLWRVEQLVLDGGFALISGDPGTGKSAALRCLQQRLNKIQEVSIVEISRATSSVLDFYRELCHAFGVEISATNRFLGYKKLRDRWLAHIDTKLFRIIILCDEAQELDSQILTELRLLTSYDLDSKMIAGVVLAGDNRLLERFKSAELLPLASRIRVRLRLESRLPADELLQILNYRLEQAGNPDLFNAGVKDILVSSCMGNIRQMLMFSNELLEEAAAKNIMVIDEKVFYECFPPERSKAKSKGAKM